jgi:hypothetical protein
MCALLAGQQGRQGHWGRRAARRHLDLHPLAAYQLQAGAPLCSTAPVAPEERRRGNGQRVQEQAHSAWMFGRLPMPLTLFAHPTGTAIADAGLIHHAQAAIRFSTLFGGSQRCSDGTAQRAIGLERKVSGRRNGPVSRADRALLGHTPAREPGRWPPTREPRAGPEQTQWSASGPA